MATKKDIDKEIMFNKIMPSGAKKQTSSEDLGRRFDPKARSVKRYEENVPEPKVEADDEYSEIDEYLERINSKSQNKPTKQEMMNLADRYINSERHSESQQLAKAEDPTRTIMVNIRERMVLERLDAAFEKFNCCTCYLCKQDVTAMALNNLKPKYIITTAGDLEKLVAKEDFSEVTSAIMKAILEVKKHPRH